MEHLPSYLPLTLYQLAGLRGDTEFSLLFSPALATSRGLGEGEEAGTQRQEGEGGEGGLAQWQGEGDDTVYSPRPK